MSPIKFNFFKKTKGQILRHPDANEPEPDVNPFVEPAKPTIKTGFHYPKFTGSTFHLSKDKCTF